MGNKTDITTEADIRLLVDEFYKTVVADEVIGFIFTEIVEFNLEKHLPIMYSFWSSLLLGKQTYSGNPMLKHIDLDKHIALQPQHFEHWLQLWESNIQARFAGAKADEAVSRAKHIAALMQYKVEQSR